VCVVPGVTPPPRHGFKDVHEGAYFIQDSIHPTRLECRSMTRLMPPWTGRRSVKHAIDEKTGNGPPSMPRQKTERAGDDDRRKPDQRIADGRAVAPLHEFFHSRARDFARI